MDETPAVSAPIPTPVRILVLSVFAALLWLLFGVAGSASADEPPASHSSLLGNVGSTLDSVTGLAAQVTGSLVASAPAPTPGVPVARRLDSVVQALPVVKTIVTPNAVETLAAPATAGVHAILGAILPLHALSGDVVGLLPSCPAVSPATVTTHAPRATVVVQRDATFTGTGAPTQSVSVGVIAPDAPPSPSAPPTTVVSISPGMASSSAPSGAPGTFVDVASVPSRADRALGRGSLPHNDSLPFSLSLAPGSSPD